MIRWRVHGASDPCAAMRRLAAADQHEGTGYATAAEECTGAALFDVDIEGSGTVASFAVRMVRRERGHELNCIAAGGPPFDGADLTAIIATALEGIARDSGAALITFTTARPGLKRKAAQLGYRPAATLYAKEVRHALIQ